MVKKLTDDEIDEVVTRYLDGEGGVQISKDFPVTPPAIYGLLERRNVERRDIGETLREKVEIKLCKNCGNEISRKKYDCPSRYKKKVFCSRECHKEFKRKSAEYGTKDGDKKNCSYCGVEFYSFRDEAKYCSRRCAYDDRDGKEEIECDNCGSEFDEYKSRILMNEHNFCSEKCSRNFFRQENHYNWDGGRDRYRGKNWDKIREKILDRDNYKCQICEAKKNLHIHHKIPFNDFDDEEEANKSSNLVTLCCSCHMKVERNSKEEWDI